MATDGCGDASALGSLAAELFQLASLLMGGEARALGLIETSLSTMEIDPCLNPEAAREQARARVVREALSELMTAEPAAFATQSLVAAAHDPCIQDDDLRAAGLTGSELRGWLDIGAKPELQSGLRRWLEALPVAQRAIFVQRAVLGQGNETAAQLLREAGGDGGERWTPQSVGRIFREALCSLANSLVHAPAGQVEFA